eukprot:CAMPEP_0197871816 /NCGR_PEP_ID=MMETSP1439-20131203/2114_1 /TAXON_ID=66791 /ORGANISM="Gonyaulax spinifera, Strain CCMP409" /LENGTH=310 /DNA_ID=CAMNT_0043490777 /DNA_START=69 /DNA_END=1001 /DNA_ORIENTATION=+
MFRSTLLALVALPRAAGQDAACQAGSPSCTGGLSSVKGAALLQVASRRLVNVSMLDTQIAETQSMGLISESAEQWLERKKIHMEQMKRERAHRDMAKGEPRGGVWWQDHYEPSFHCELEERVGMMGDGGKWVCDPSTIARKVAAGAPCLVYSVGSNGDFSFEEAVKKTISPHCEVHVFDPAPKGEWTPPAGVTYHSMALGDGKTGKTMKQIVSELGHGGRHIDLFKIDCEGCEWSTYKHWLDAGVELRQIMVEMHWGPVKGDTDKAHGLFDHLFQNGYVVFNKEPNTLGCQGECIEYSFLKLDPSFSSEK